MTLRVALTVVAVLAVIRCNEQGGRGLKTLPPLFLRLQREGREYKHLQCAKLQTNDNMRLTKELISAL